MEMLGIALFGMGVGFLSSFLEVCMEEDMIFERYGQWVREKADTNMRFKPLGACVYCYNFWVTLVATLIYGNIVYMPIILGFSYASLKIIDRLNDG